MVEEKDGEEREKERREESIGEGREEKGSKRR